MAGTVFPEMIYQVICTEKLSTVRGASLSMSSLMNSVVMSFRDLLIQAI